MPNFKNLIISKLTVCIRSLQFDIFAHARIVCLLLQLFIDNLSTAKYD